MRFRHLLIDVFKASEKRYHLFFRKDAQMHLLVKLVDLPKLCIQAFDLTRIRIHGQVKDVSLDDMMPCTLHQRLPAEAEIISVVRIVKCFQLPGVFDHRCKFPVFFLKRRRHTIDPVIDLLQTHVQILT